MVVLKRRFVIEGHKVYSCSANPASSRFSRFTFGLGLKSNNASSSRARENAIDDSQWYIPYSGPVEPPREPLRRFRERDSWGDPIEGDEEEDDTALTSIDLHQHYTSANSQHSHAGDVQMYGASGDGSVAGHRARVQSGVSGRTVSSGVVDPSRMSVLSQRRSTITSSVRPLPFPTSGGVGESPMPPTHRRRPSKEGNRGSIAGFFSFAGQTRNRTPSEKGPKLLPKKLAKSGQSSSGPGSSAGHRRSSSTGSNSLMGRSNLGHGADDYYNSYYFSTNASQNTRSNETSHHPYSSDSAAVHQEEAATPTSTSGSDTRHPYSYIFPTSNGDDGPRTAPLPSSHPIASSSKHPAPPPKLMFTESQAPHPASVTLTQTQFTRSFPFQLKQLKISASTPDLHVSTSVSPTRHRAAKPSSKTKTKDRWLAAETWCDALLFPRPRLKIKGSSNESDTGRIVSLPPSPIQRVQQEQPLSNGVPGQGVASRVLAHSRSLADLDKPPCADAIEEIPSTKPGSSIPPTGPQPPRSGRPGIPPLIQTPRDPRPKSWALDDLALPTPVPSLARVVEEGEKFDNQRKQWQVQATHSFQNKLTRSISRNRSKSLTQKGRRNDETRPSNIDFLAARAYLGNQLLTPVVGGRKSPDTQNVVSDFNGASRTSHSHSNSLAKTWSKSSKSHSRGHSRSDSFGRGLFKKAKPLGWPNGGDLATDNKLENALKGDDTKIIRLADPALARNLTPLTTNSPTPPDSLISDARIGIALTTPPLVDDPVDADAMRLPAHPYAQGGLFSLRSSQARDEEDAPIPNYVVPNSPARDWPTQVDAKDRRDFSPNDDTPPIVPYHPYAQQPSSRNSFLPDTKFTNSDIPAPSKMWAQLSPGVLREVHPNDIQYSPFLSENGDDLDSSSLNSRLIYDTAGIGETLAYAVHPKSSKDTGLSTAKGHDIDESQVPPTLAPKRSYKQLVQYDPTRPSHLSLYDKGPVNPYSAHTFASSPLLDQQQTHAPDMPRHDSYDMPAMRTTSTSPESMSPPHSPRLFGDPDDLEGFYDLFYNPNRPSRRIASEASHTSASDTPLGSWRQGSGLTSLARQLSEEIEQMGLDHDDAPYPNEEFQGSIARRPTGSTLEFVFEETSSPGSASTGLSPPGQSTISPFQPSSENIPEDVESSRASSPLEPGHDETALRIGMVGLLSTPPVVDGDHRTSYMGQMSSPIDKEGHANGGQELSPQSRVNSGLQPPSADPTRSSYLTTSSMSGMSGLSDFPAPPQRHATEHMSILTSYFSEAHSLSQIEASRDNTPPPIPFDDTNINDSDGQSNTHLTIGGEEKLELAAALSSHSHSTLRH
ncbi:hypothetical protein H0H87_012959 [Tephrocybe sp. NHM501043]|nr:hypothetical protein H0H87_012959 [Tephrocybe sp. NHM501043]